MESRNKARALTKQEIQHLITLIESSKIINSVSTNSAANKLKNEEWDRITELFNKNLCPNDHRTHQQLRNKLENLKRKAKNRTEIILKNQSRLANGEEAEYIPPDDILDRVAILLTGTIEGFTDHFGGDSVNNRVEEPQFVNERVEGIELESVHGESGFMLENNEDHNECFDDGFEENGHSNDDGRRVRNLAIAEYYAAKSRLADAIFQNIHLENEKLKLEISEYKKEMDKSETKHPKQDDNGRTVRNLAITEYKASKSRLTDANFQNMRLENEKLKLEISEYKKEMSKS